ncbi:MAG: hypothetical protein R3C11_02865 [Planctomycetaceae bacterium]
MPFTPYHMGPAFPVKGACGTRFSLMLYGYTQVLMDLEALYHILNRHTELHGYSHTFAGATTIGIVALLTGKPLFEWWFRVWNQTVESINLHHMKVAERLSWKVAMGSVFFGSWMHILLDAIMHPDMHPFLPFSDQNPFLRLISVRELHLFCLITLLLGVGWVGLKWLFKKQTDE